MAKKPRTPAPPRPVQAPKRRETKGKRVAQPNADRRTRLILAAFALSGVVAVAVVATFIFTRGKGSSGDANGKAQLVHWSKLSGLQSGPPPWQPGYNGLPDRIAPLGLNALSKEALVYHIHQHLDLFMDGKPVTVPKFIGIYDNQFITELHTHDAQAEGLPGAPTRPTGVIHVESSKKTVYSLGQFFGIWGVKLTRRCLGDFCAKPLKAYVNGKLWKTDPGLIPLREREQIAIVYGKPPAKIPSTFTWTSSL